MIVNRSMDLTYITQKAYRVVDIGREVTVTSILQVHAIQHILV